MTIGRGTSLAALLLSVGAAALLSGMVRSVATGFHFPPPPPMNFFGVRPFPTDLVICLFLLGLSVLTGLACGIGLAIRGRRRIRVWLMSAAAGCALGGLAGAQLDSKADCGMTLIGSVALVVYGFVIHCTATSSVRTEAEIEWFAADEGFDRPTT